MINRRSTPSGDGRGRGRTGGSSGRGGRPAYRSDDTRGGSRRDDDRGHGRDSRGEYGRSDSGRENGSARDSFRADRSGSRARFGKPDSRDDRPGFRSERRDERPGFRSEGRGDRSGFRSDGDRGGFRSERRDDRPGFRSEGRGDRSGFRSDGDRGGFRSGGREGFRSERRDGGSRYERRDDRGYQDRDGGDRRAERPTFRAERPAFRADRSGRREDTAGPARARYGRTDAGGREDDRRSPARRDEGGFRSDERGPRRDEGGFRSDERGPRRDERGPRRDEGGFRSDERGSRRDAGGFRADSRGSRRDDGRPSRDEGGRAPRTGGRTPGTGRTPRRDDVQTIGGRPTYGGGPRRDGYGGDRGRGEAAPRDRFKTARQPMRDRDLYPEGYTDERDTTEVPDGVRLQKVLAQAGVASRRACEEMIGDGRVTVNGQVVRRFGAKVDPAKQIIHVDGKRIPTAPDLVYYALNKPIGVVSTMDDPQGRPCLADYVQELAPRLFHVGRLDTETEGLLLLTNDGELANRLTHPSYGVQKKYWAKVPGPIPRDLGRRLRQGIELEDGLARADSFQIVQEHGQQALVEVVLHEGRKHVVRRMLEEAGHRVIDLARIEFGPVKLGRTKPGTVRALSLKEVGELYAAVKL
ncbi:23S rRNA pseudouridine2605 synthase [Nonomuraea muscovyensis]|uniref:Pseudouridine synthase n=1 Tax=Nonomuraea muscovyensis TaxID=1124761 RepID=A0A7X0BVW1_9ACTN|nr:pseudouridine synthase [Nonomuraea muscovyensis]MBB6343857.1 23S rRNA pseudouridine2605 synthase [Nonomuraea muscovyensis]